jgi:type II secretory pathway pseudopilin PulG
MGIIAALAVALIPAINSLSKSSGRKGAISNLLGVIEQARAQAIKDGQSTYVVFPAQPAGGSSTITDKVILDGYFYRSVAIFEDDAANPGSRKQLTPWKTFAAGVCLRSAISASPWASDLSFAFTPAGSNKTENFPYLKFNSNGEVESPVTASGPVQITVFEGFVNGTTEVVTGKKDGSGNPLAAESITVARLTGRAERMQ